MSSQGDRPRRWPLPWSPRRDRVFDLALGGVLLLPTLTFLFAGIGAAATLLSMAQIAPLFWRRTRPLLVFALVSAAMVAQLPLTEAPIWGQVAMPVAVYSVAAFTGPRQARVALGVGLVGAVVGPLDWLVGPDRFDLLLLGLWVMTTALLVIAPWAFGTLARTRRAYVAQLIDRGERLEREAAQQAALAASEERSRIAREMHDIVSHGLSVMVVQADGARYAAAKDPDAAARALQAISDTGREALTDMRRMLGLLRSPDGTTGTRPQPGIADLAALLDQAAASGLRLRAEVEQPLPTVDTGVGLVVYRVLQESLTNVRKHAGPDPEVRVVLRRAGEDLLVEVVDDGRGAGAGDRRDDRKGHGLLGMQERIAAVGGTFEAGPRPGGGFAVRACLPLAGERR
jgi:signal transduction histidine kinase